MRRKQFVWGPAAVLLLVALAAGWAAYANIPDSSGVIHGCYSPNGANGTNGAQLNIINSDSASCSKGQKEIIWNQTGPQGPPGPGATTFTATVAQDNAEHTLATLDNGVTIKGACTGFPDTVVRLNVYATGFGGLQMSGTKNQLDTISSADLNGATDTSFPGATEVDFDGLARDSTVGKFARIDVHGTFGNPCTFWGMIIPSE